MPSSVVFEIISIVSFAMSGLLFIIAAVLFFKFKIPSVVGYLSGNTAKKKIREMQQGGYKEKSGETDTMTDKLVTAQMPFSKSKNKHKKAEKESVLQTEVLDGTNETDVLDSENQTTVLNESGTTVVYGNILKSSDNSEEIGITQTLNNRENENAQPVETDYSKDVDYTLETDIKFIHTSETIE